MKIGDKEYSEILITDADGGLLASITDKDIIEEKNCKVVCVPDDNYPRLFLLELSGLETGVYTPLIFLT